LPKLSLIPLIKPIEATKIHPRTGVPLGLPEITIPYGALVEHVGSDPDRDREKFTYLSELYTCKRQDFLSATGGVKSPPKPTAASAPPAGAPASVPVVQPIAEKVPEPAVAPGPRLEWAPVNSSDYPVSRAAVPGGWLVALNGSSATFVPDPKHQWDGTSPEFSPTLRDAEFISIAESLDRCWMEGRFDDLESFLAEDVVFVAPGGKYRGEGLAQAIESYRQFTSNAQVNRFKTSDHVVTLRGDTAVVEYQWEMSWISAGAEHNETGRDVLVVSRRDDKWRVVWRTQIPGAKSN